MRRYTVLLGPFSVSGSESPDTREVPGRCYRAFGSEITLLPSGGIARRLQVVVSFGCWPGARGGHQEARGALVQLPEHRRVSV